MKPNEKYLYQNKTVGNKSYTRSEIRKHDQAISDILYKASKEYYSVIKHLTPDERTELKIYYSAYYKIHRSTNITQILHYFEGWQVITSSRLEEIDRKIKIEYLCR